jgi:SAM-dependent methyltransferase
MTADGWDGTANLSAYADVESIENYGTAAQMRTYREERLGFHARQVEFVRGLGVPANGLRIVDVGSGSSAFLYALDRAGLLAHGLGIEVSPSRHAFAERWRTDEQFTRVTNVCANFRDVPFDAASLDAFTVLDETYLYLRPEGDDYPSVLLERAAHALVPAGHFIAAFRNDAPFVKHMEGQRTFRIDLPESNPFRYALYRQDASADGRTLRTESVYIARDAGERRKVEFTEVCDVDELGGRLLARGFSQVDRYADFVFAPFDPNSSPNLVLVARR